MISYRHEGKQRNNRKGKQTKTYKVKEEYWSKWGAEVNENTIITEDEVNRLSAEWGVSHEDLVEQLEEISQIWFAVQETSEDSWDYGSHDLDEAIEMLREQGHGLIAVIEEGSDPVCINEFKYEDLF